MSIFRGPKEGTLPDGSVVATQGDIAEALTATQQAQAAAEAAQAAAEAALDNFDDRYLGAKSSDPTVDNDGDALIDGALYYNTTDNITKVYDLGTTTWINLRPSASEQSSINAVASISADVTTVAGIDSDVTTVSGISADVTTVSGLSPDIATVIADQADIGTVATNIANVNSVATDIADVNSVATDIANVSTVATDISSVNTVSTNIADVNTVASALGTPLSAASGVSYDNTTTELTATDVQAALDEVYGGSFQVVEHGDVPGTERPAGAGAIYWRGTAAPVFGEPGDVWDETVLVNSTVEGLWIYRDGAWRKGSDVVLATASWVSVHDTTLSTGTTVEMNFGPSTGDREIDWGDGTVEIVNTALPSHTYASDGEYTVTCSGGVTERLGERENSPVEAWTATLTKVLSWGELGWTNFDQAFFGCANNFDVPNTFPSTVTKIDRMLVNASAFNQDISSWNVSSVTSMFAVFVNASAFNQDISSWNVSSVTDMSAMFVDASSFNQPLNSWDVSAVTDMSKMFKGTPFNQPLNSWNVSSVTSMSNMFRDASSFNQPLNSWDVSTVTNMSVMFTSASSFNQPLNSWDVSSVTDMRNMFQQTPFNQDISSWNVSSVTNMTAMFRNADAFQKDLSPWDFAAVTDLANFMLDKTGADAYNTTDYNALLIRWDDLVTNSTMANNLVTDMGDAQHSGAGTTARTNLINAGWTIVDGGAA